MTAAVMKINQELNGIEVYFDSKPMQKVLDTLSDNGFRWSGFKKCWYTKQSEKAFQIANSLTADNEKASTEAVNNVIEIKNNKENNKMVIDYGFAKVPIGFNDLDTILHSYCITIHKSQGSAANAVVVVFDKSHTYQLNANLIYTAITRAREHVFMLCQANVINRAVKKVANMQRNTFLWELLVYQNA